MANITVGYNAAGNALDYTTIGGVGGAYAAASHEDNLQIWYSDANRNHAWYEYITGNGLSSKGVSIEGMLPKRGVTLLHRWRFYYLSANLSAYGAQLTWQNFTINQIDTDAYQESMAFDDTSYSGPGVLVKNVEFVGSERGLRLDRFGHDVVRVQNCIFKRCRYALHAAYSAKRFEVFNCTFVMCAYTMYLSANNYIRLKNCALFGITANILNLSGAGYVIDYNVSNDADADTYGTNGYINQEYPDMGFLWNNSNDKFPQDFRVMPGAYLLGKGTDVGLTEDIDGNDYTGGPYPIGASDGITLGAVSSDPGIANVDKDVAYTINDAALVGTMETTDPGIANVRLATGYIIKSANKTGNVRVPAEAQVEDGVDFDTLDTLTGTYDNATDPDHIIDTQGGNWEVSNVTGLPENVRQAITYGLNGTETGTLAPGGSPPDEPTLTVDDKGDGTADFTIAGASAGSVNSIFKRLATGAWPSVADYTINGNGTTNETIDPGVYYGKVESVLGGLTSPGATDPVPFSIIDSTAGYVRSDFGDEFKDVDQEFLLDALDALEDVTYKRGASTVTVNAVLGSVFTAYDDSTGLDLAIGDSSWSIDAEALDLGAGPIEPQMHDQIITSLGHVYEVQDVGGMDSERIRRLIPTVRIEYTQ